MEMECSYCNTTAGTQAKRTTSVILVLTVVVGHLVCSLRGAFILTTIVAIRTGHYEQHRQQNCQYHCKPFHCEAKLQKKSCNPIANNQTISRQIFPTGGAAWQNPLDMAPQNGVLCQLK